AVSRPGSRRRENGMGSDGVLSARVDSGPTPSFEAGTFPSDDERGEDKFETMTIFRYGRNLKIAGAAGFVALVIVAAIVGFRRPQWSPVKPPAAAHAMDVPAPATPAPAPPAAVAATPPAVAAPAAAPPAPPAPAAPVAAAKAAPANADVAQPARPKTYERLVAEAD